jgi:hypothetical protein
LAPSFIVLSDLHLSHGGSRSLARDCAALVRAHRGTEIVFAGDAFSLSNDPSERDPVESITTLVTSERDLAAALREHLSSDSKLTLLAGNHDAAVGEPRTRRALLSALELREDAPLSLEPWFIRRGGVHVEHGHLWDPDNAPAHPLSSWSGRTEPLGIALTRRFIARYGVWQFAHAHETTVAGGLSRAFELFGARAPLLIARYFLSSGALCAQSLFERGLGDERARGQAALGGHTARTGVDAAALEALIDAAPEPTHLRFRNLFLRLYYDRVFASLGLGAGLAGLAFAASPLGAAVAVGSGAYLGWNVRYSGSRYQNRPIQRLREGSELVRRITNARLVVFGHTHVPESAAGYANPGSFGYPGPGAGRPFLSVDADGNAKLETWPVKAG